MKLKSSLLLTIIEHDLGPQKYTSAYNRLKNVLQLERDEEQFKIPEDIEKRFEDLQQRFDDFKDGIPLDVVERYYIDNASNLQRFVFLAYDGKELSDMYIIELYRELEKFHREVFDIAVRLANYYALELKVNYDGSESSDNPHF